jgi:hypothetical protein
VADFDSSLPVRTVSAEELQVKTKVGTSLDSNLKQLNGITPAVNTGNADAGTLRVVLATNQPTVPVSFSASLRTPQFDYSMAASVAALASSTQTVTPAANIRLEKVIFAGSGQGKVEIQIGTTGGETTRAVLYTSKGSLNASWDLPSAMQVTPAMSIKVIRTNLDNQSQDLHSTIQSFVE